jgi:hypothetical protein
MIELVIARESGEVPAELIEHGRTGRRVGGLGAGGTCAHRFLPLVTREQLDHLLPDTRQVGAEALQHLGGHTLALADQPEEHVLGTDVTVTELERLAERQLEHLFRTRGERGGPGGCGSGESYRLFDLLPHSLQRDAERFERLGRDTLTFVDEPQEDVLGANKAVVQQARLLLCEDENSASTVCKSFEHPPPPYAVGNSPKSTGGSAHRTRTTAFSSTFSGIGILAYRL